MKQISIKDEDLIMAVIFRASKEFGVLFLNNGLVDLYNNLQTCYKRLDLRQLLKSGSPDFLNDITAINQYHRINCLKQKRLRNPLVAGRA
jgi:hypothetical protein